MNKEKNNTAPADPEQWSDKSKKSYSYHYIKKYTDQEYNCVSCKKNSVFTAKDQKYTYEVKKSYIDQQRHLCCNCWKESINITKKIKECEGKWKESKNTLKTNKQFLSLWLELLIRKENFTIYKANTAIKNMLNKYLDQEIKKSKNR